MKIKKWNNLWVVISLFFYILFLIKMKGLFRVLLIYERDSLYKAKIYEFLFFHNKEVPFSILSQLFDLHNTTIKRYLSELQEIEFLKNELFISKTSVICIKKNVLPLELIKYFKANGIFIDILNMIYKNKYLTIECLAQRLYVSSSHLGASIILCK